jgi:hypothetical protein
LLSQALAITHTYHKDVGDSEEEFGASVQPINVRQGHAENRFGNEASGDGGADKEEEVGEA